MPTHNIFYGKKLLEREREPPFTFFISSRKHWQCCCLLFSSFFEEKKNVPSFCLCEECIPSRGGRFVLLGSHFGEKGQGGEAK